MKRIHVIQPGKFTAEDGTTHEFTLADCQQMAASYNPRLSEAPIVVGHPKTNSPAFGWIGAVTCDGNGDVFVEPSHVDPQFAEAVDAQHFKKVSLKLWAPENPNNPTPGQWYIQHVGFLGGKAPAVKGLREIEFSTDAGITVSLAGPDDSDDAAISGLLRNVRGFILRKFGSDEAESTLPQAVLDALEVPGDSSDVPQAIDSLDAGTKTPQVSISDPEQKMADEAELERLRAENAQLKAAQESTARAERERQTAARRERVVALCEGAVKAGRLLPADRPMLVEVGMSIADGKTVQFSSADQPQDLLAAFSAFVERLPVQVSLTAAAGGAPNNSAQLEPQFAAPDGRSVEANRLRLHGEAHAYMQQHRVDYLTAVRAVEKH